MLPPSETEGLTGGGATARFFMIAQFGRACSGFRPINLQSSSVILYNTRKVSSGQRMPFRSLVISKLSSLNSTSTLRLPLVNLGCL